MKAIIVGTGRSGSGYVSKLLTEAGFPCGHEQVFTYKGITPSALQADSSWMAVPYLSHYPNTPIVLVHREPVDVIASYVGIKFFEVPSPYRAFLLNKNPALRTLDPFEASCQHYIDWNRRALDYATLVVGLDQGRWGDVADEVGANRASVEAARARVSTRYNMRQRAAIDLDRIPDEVWETRAELMEASS